MTLKPAYMIKMIRSNNRLKRNCCRILGIEYLIVTFLYDRLKRNCCCILGIEYLIVPFSYENRICKHYYIKRQKEIFSTRIVNGPGRVGLRVLSVWPSTYGRPGQSGPKPCRACTTYVRA